MTLVEAARALAELKYRIEASEHELNEMKRSYKASRAELLSIMASAGTKNVKVITEFGDRLVSTRRICGANVTDRDKFRDWCGKAGFDETDFMIWSKAALAGFMRDHLDEQRPLPDGVDGWQDVDLSVRKG